jgi:hypothetical protein
MYRTIPYSLLFFKEIYGKVYFIRERLVLLLMCQARQVHEFGEFVGVVLVEGADGVAVGVEDAPAGAVRVEEGDDDFGSVAWVAGDVVFAEVFDIVDDNGFAGLPGLAAGTVEFDGAARG